MDYRRRPHVMDKDPLLNEAFEDLVGRIENIRQQTNIATNGDTLPPPPVATINVIAAQGIFDVALSDNSSNISRGIHYFLEYSTSPFFTTPTVIHLGASRNWRGMLGNQLFYWRGYSSYPTSPRSEPVYFGTKTQPTGVLGGGTSAGPAPLGSNGSGTSLGAGAEDGGFGNQQYRGKKPPQLS